MARRLGPDLDAGKPGFPMGKLAIWRDGLGPPHGDAGLTGAYKSPGSAWPGVNVKMSIGIVLQAADGSVPAEEGQYRAPLPPTLKSTASPVRWRERGVPPTPALRCRLRHVEFTVMGPKFEETSAITRRKVALRQFEEALHRTGLPDRLRPVLS
jgi:hypothetical protein